MASKHKTFAEMSLHEMAETLINSTMPDGTVIDSTTRIASLSMVLSLLRHHCREDELVVREIGEDRESFEDFLAHHERERKLIETAAEICGGRNDGMKTARKRTSH